MESNKDAAGNAEIDSAEKITKRKNRKKMILLIHTGRAVGEAGREDDSMS